MQIMAVQPRYLYAKINYLCLMIVLMISGLNTINLNAQVYNGSPWFQRQIEIDTFNYTSVTGSIRIDDQNHPGDIKNLDGLSELTSIEGSLVLFWTDSLQDLSGLSNLTTIGHTLAVRFTTIRSLDDLNLTSVKNIWLDANTYLNDISSLSSITTVDTLWITWNTNLENLDGLANISGSVDDLAIFRNNLDHLDWLSNITAVEDTLWLAYEPLKNINGLSGIASIGGGIHIHNLFGLNTFCGLYNVLSSGGLTGGFLVYDNSYNPTVQDIIDCGPCSGIDVPTAIGDENRQVIVGTPVTLDGSASSDPSNNSLEYIWYLYFQPGQSTASLSDSTIVNPTFTPDLPGTYYLYFRVFDGCAISDADYIYITAITIDEASENITEDILSLPINSGNKNALTSKLQNAIDKYNSGELNAARNLFNAFLNQLNQFITNGSITQAQAQPIIDYVNIILDAINSALPKELADINLQLPTEFSLQQNYPNPFNPVTLIKWQLPEESKVSIKIYDVLGNQIAILVDAIRPAGFYETPFDASRLSSGIYYYRIDAGDFSATKKMILLK